MESQDRSSGRKSGDGGRFVIGGHEYKPSGMTMGLGDVVWKLEISAFGLHMVPRRRPDGPIVRVLQVNPFRGRFARERKRRYGWLDNQGKNGVLCNVVQAQQETESNCQSALDHT